MSPKTDAKAAAKAAEIEIGRLRAEITELKRELIASEMAARVHDKHLPSTEVFSVHLYNTEAPGGPAMVVTARNNKSPNSLVFAEYEQTSGVFKISSTLDPSEPHPDPSLLHALAEWLRIEAMPFFDFWNARFTVDGFSPLAIDEDPWTELDTDEGELDPDDYVVIGKILANVATGEAELEVMRSDVLSSQSPLWHADVWKDAAYDAQEVYERKLQEMRNEDLAPPKLH
jgi:hypothetical protein